MTQDRPASVRAAMLLTWALVALWGVTCAFAVVFKDELMDAWESGRVDAGSVKPPAIVPVTVVMLIVVALVAVVLIEFFRARHGWARTALTVTIVLMALSTAATLKIGPPALFVVLSVASLLLQVGLVVVLWRRDTTAFLQAHPAPEELTTGS